MLAYNDLLAIGALGVLRHRGRRVPEDVRVIGIDGLSIGDLVVPRLSTLAVDMAEVGRLATELALGMCSGELPLSGAGRPSQGAAPPAAARLGLIAALSAPRIPPSVREPGSVRNFLALTLE